MLHQGDVFPGSITQAEWFGRVPCSLRDKRDVNRASSTQVQRIFILKQAIEVRNAGNSLHKLTLGLAGRVNQFEDGANQSPIAVARVGTDNLRTTDPERDAFILPGMSPQAGAGHQRVS